VESEPGKGAKFFVELPLVACASAPAPAKGTGDPTAEIDPQAADYRVLIADDEPGIRDVLQAVLSANGYVTDTAVDGVEALKLLQQHEYDLVLSDLCMPEMDGPQLYDQVQQRNPRLASRIVFVTGDTVSIKTRSFLERTGNRWVSKPFNISAVEDLVRTMLHTSRSAEAKVLETLSPNGG
jgi:CheY-like chemotaxis protein